MSLQSQARADLATIASLIGEAAVAVVSGAESGTGIRGVTTKETSPSEYGDMGTTVNIVRVSAATFSEPARGATITVAGQPVFVITARLDPAGATRVFEYSEQKPNSGV